MAYNSISNKNKQEFFEEINDSWFGELFFARKQENYQRLTGLCQRTI